jgi:hypothetical protein
MPRFESTPMATKGKQAEDQVRGSYTGRGNMIKRKFLPLFDTLAEKHRQNLTRRPEPPARINWHALRHFAVSC